MGFNRFKILGLAAGLVPLALGGYLVYRAFYPVAGTPSPQDDEVVVPMEAPPGNEPEKHRATAANGTAPETEPVVESRIDNGENVTITREAPPEKFRNQGELASALAEICGMDGIPGTFLAAGNPAKRIVQIADAFANGERPVTPLNFLLPPAAFRASRDSRGRMVIAEQSTARWQSAVDAFCNIPAQKIAAIYFQAEELLQEACDNIGYRGTPVKNIILGALETVENIPLPDENPELVPNGPNSFRFRDNTLEELNDAQKLILRLGLDNCRKVQNQCRQLTAELNKTE